MTIVGGFDVHRQQITFGNVDDDGLVHCGAVTIVPVTSNIRKIHPFQVLLSAATGRLAADSKAQAEQVRSIAT
jgi:mRNA-degrading endonuclease toxin of MazEF toxin-antitoxin module